MVNGVITLRCPACTRPFLSLPQQSGTMVTCPYCARSAARESYTLASGVGGPPVASLPIQRRIIPARPGLGMSTGAVPAGHEPGAGTRAPFSGLGGPAGGPFSSPAAPAPAPAPGQAQGQAQGQGSLPAWPPAPEQVPAFSPQPQASLLPPAPPVATPGWPSMMPSGVSPFGVAAEPLPPAVQAPASLSGLPFSPASGGAAAPVPPPAFLPSMGFAAREEPGGDHPAEQDYEAAPSWKPARDGRNVPLGILLVLVLGFGGWVVWQNSQPPLAAEFQAPTAVLPPVVAGPVTPPAKTEPPELPPAKAAVSPSLPAVEEKAAAAPPAMPESEIRRAELPLPPGAAPVPAAVAPAIQKVDLVAASEAADRLMKALLSADTAAKRAATIAQADEYGIDVEEFFEPGPVKLKSVKLTEVTPRMLPGQALAPLFQVMTDKGPQAGALLRLVPEGADGFLLDWPLFAETHERRLKKFLESKPEAPAWFHVILRRSHALDLPEAIRKTHLCLDLQSSADGADHCSAVVPVETPLERFLDREAEWGNLYIARLLLQCRTVEGGLPGVVILDCEGAVMGAVFPSGAVKR